jgi:hypothetical protein
MREPPKVVRWLLGHLGSSPNNGAIIGDLDERYRLGRSRLWYWRQVLLALASQRGRTVSRISIAIYGELAMLRIGITFLLLTLLIVRAAFLVFHGSVAELLSVAEMVGNVSALAILILLILRGVWRSSSRALHILQWPTAIAAANLGLSGIATVLGTAWLGRQGGGMMDGYQAGLGCFLLLIGLLSAFSLLRSSPSTN